MIAVDGLRYRREIQDRTGTPVLLSFSLSSPRASRRRPSFSQRQADDHSASRPRHSSLSSWPASAPVSPPPLRPAERRPRQADIHRRVSRMNPPPLVSPLLVSFGKESHPRPSRATLSAFLLVVARRLPARFRSVAAIN